ncbi:zinc finger CCCH domain-containing protein 3-like isoform X2 [Malania oleifera]|uniref:zinc finger CCCH domain-containing protein 3-like isoform X2 n=1 Tax=Malania oleifera TaxID=397392 RepID=UPI0025AE84B7|nr:zinc finger CCCH domain-containing protein 3-like isoform X2 [Malania oleifera]
MPDNRQAQNNAVSNPPSSDTIQVWRLKTRDNQEGDVARSSPYPDRPGEPDCIYYLRTGLCGYGSNCRFNHPSSALQGAQSRGELPQRAGQPDCGYFLKTGTCKYGSTCKYHHPRDRHGAGPVSLNMLGLPIRQEEKPCPYYMRTGLCKFGAACKFHHPQPWPGTVLPVAGTAALGVSGTSVAPSSGLPYVGGLSTWSFPRAPYLSGQRVQGPQAYMPVVYSPSQGILPSHGWNTYVGNMSPISSAGVLGPSLVYNSRNQGDSGSVGQVHLMSPSIPNFPERPDQPECRYFMNTGSCKYGSDCKYHHPKERIAQLGANNMGPFGLPLRPGQPVCSYYNLYGLCKYGPTCKFDHPVAGYSYNYSLSLPSLSVLDSSLFSHQRNSPAANGSEMAPSKSSKISEWIPKPEPSSRKHQKADTPHSETQPEETDPPPQTSTSEIPQHQSD